MILLINCCLKARLPCRCSDGACHSGFTATVCHIGPSLPHWHSVPYCAIPAPLGTTLLVAAVVSHQETPRLLISYFHIFLLSLAPLVILQSFLSQSSFSEQFNQQEVFQEKKKWWKVALIFPFGTEDKQTVNNKQPVYDLRISVCRACLCPGGSKWPFLKL